MRKPKVVVVGSMNMDLSVRVGRLPRPGETVSGGDLERGAGGKGANQAVAAQLLGARTALIGRIGADEFGGELRGALRRAGVDDSAVTVDDGASGSALVLVDSAGENMITVSPGANGTFVPSGLDQHADRIASADALLLQLEVPTATCLAAARTARAAQVLVVLNAAPLPPDIGPELVELIACADILVVNEGEAVSLLDAVSGCSEREPMALAVALRALGPSEVVITLGARGAVYTDADGRSAAVPPFAVNAIDAVGAGDVFCAALTVARASGSADLGAAVRRACAAGALATMRRGAQSSVPGAVEVDAFVSEQSSRRSTHAY
ncbi:ribokinase [Nocardia sp. NBC_01503]|uniref:ribokinase n=1 Tax=Nocardia sp. NBC_01503 TaxID=2975997 RepID=UPI002E7B3691|nr:ribokinase [Nocardia sp. NBC_01503]WTL30835.1 ribokinase [Nocardia sp. NBC_01503]